jgi:hypothetical protein
VRAISLKLPQALDRRLTELAARRKTSRSAIIREALESYALQPPRTFGGVNSHLAGSLKGGPKDLSTSKRHLKGYGE